MSRENNHTPIVNLPDTPYKGLEPYSEADANFFFGRESEWEIIADNLRAARLTLLYGVSGVGKSSLLRAGVAHHLMEDAKKNLAEYGTPEFAVVVFNAWQDDPLVGLVKKVEKDIKSLLKGKTFELLPSSQKLDQILEICAERLDVKGGVGELLIVLDQFEEYFLYHPNEQGARTFADEFPLAVNRPDLPVNFLISIREDSLAKLDHFKASIPNIFDNYLRVKHLDAQSAYDAISKPIEKYNHLSPYEEPINLNKGLVKVVIDQVSKIVKDNNGRGITNESRVEFKKQIEAPYLQLVMEYLWKEEINNRHSDSLRLLTLLEIGGAEKIVKEHLNKQMESLKEDERKAAAKIFQYLVTPSGTKIAYPVLDLVEITKLREKELKDLLETLSSGSQRILRPVGPSPSNPEVERYEIFHDVLAEPILDWVRTYTIQKTKVQLKIREIELLSLDALRQFQDEVLQLKALRNAMRAGNLLKQIRNETTLEDTVKARVMLALQKILDGIQEQNQIQHPGSPIYAMCLSRDGQKLATGSADGVMAIWDLHGHCICSFGNHKSIVPSLSFHPDGTQLAVAYLDGHIQIWNLQGKMLAEFQQAEQVYCIQFSPDGQVLAVGLANGITQLLDLHGHPVAECSGGHQGGVYRIQFSPDGRHLLTASPMDITDVSACLWTTQGDRVTKFGVPGKMIYDISFSPDGQFVATAFMDKTVFLWDIQGSQRAEFKGHEGIISQVDFTPDGQHIRTVAWDGTARWWDTEGHQISKLKICKLPILQGSFTPDSCHLVILSMDGTVHLWNTATQQNAPVTEVNSQEGMMHFCVDFHPDGQRLLTTSADGTAILCNLHGELLRIFEGHQKEVYRARFSPDGNMIATASADGTARLWNLEGETLVTFEDHTDPVAQVSFSPNGELIATASFDRTARLWNCHGKQLYELKGHHGQVYSVSFSPDGRYVATASTDTLVRLWTVDGNFVRELRGHGSIVNYVNFSRDGRYLATASSDGSAQIWEPNGKRVAKCRGHSGIVYWTSFSPDGSKLATASGDYTVRLWDMKGNQLAEFKDHQDIVFCVQFSPDGKYLATASADGTSKLRRIEKLDDLLARGCAWLHDYFETHSQEQEHLNLCGYASETDLIPLVQSDSVPEVVK